MPLADQAEPFRHIDRNPLTGVAAPSLNPLARLAAREGSLGIASLRHTSY